MLWFTALLACASCTLALASTKSKTFVDSSTGVTFQRVHEGDAGRSVSIAFPPQGARASDAIIQMTGPISDGFAGLSPSATLTNAVILVTCCWCCTNAKVASPSSSPAQPMFGARQLSNSAHIASESRSLATPLISQFAPSEITDTTYKVTFRCQNCTFAESKATGLTTMSVISSTRRPGGILDPTVTVTSTDNVRRVEFDLSAARFADYWNIVPPL